MRIAREMEVYRREYRGMVGDHEHGLFIIPARHLKIIAAAGMGWDHVSVSRPDRCPTWDEMHWVRGKFFRPEETVIQIDPPEAMYVNKHPYCLHLWRPHDVEIPLPPSIMVG